MAFLDDRLFPAFKEVGVLAMVQASPQPTALESSTWCADRPWHPGRGLRGGGQDHNVNCLIPAADCDPIGAASGVLRLNQRVKRSCKHDLAGRRVSLKASTNVDGIAERCEIQYGSRSDIADEGDTSVGRDTKGKLGDLRGEFDSCDRCLASIFGARNALDEKTHHFVADQLVHNAFIVNQHLCCCPIELIQTLGERGGIRLLAQSGRSSHVGEHNSDVDLDASGRQAIEAELADVRILTGGLVSKEANHFPADATKGIQAKLASRIVRKVTKDPLRDLQGLMTLDEQSFPIDGFRHSRTMSPEKGRRQGREIVHRSGRTAPPDAAGVENEGRGARHPDSGASRPRWCW